MFCFVQLRTVAAHISRVLPLVQNFVSQTNEYHRLKEQIKVVVKNMTKC